MGRTGGSGITSSRPRRFTSSKLLATSSYQSSRVPGSADRSWQIDELSSPTSARADSGESPGILASVSFASASSPGTVCCMIMMISSRLVGMPPGAVSGSVLPPSSPGSSFPPHAPPPRPAGVSRGKPDRPPTDITVSPPANAVTRFLPDSGFTRMVAALTLGPGAAWRFRSARGPAIISVSAPGASVAACRMPRHRGRAFPPGTAGAAGRHAPRTDVNRRINRGVSNSYRTSGYVDASNLQSRRYVVLSGGLEE